MKRTFFTLLGVGVLGAFVTGCGPSNPIDKRHEKEAKKTKPTAELTSSASPTATPTPAAIDTTPVIDATSPSANGIGTQDLNTPASVPSTTPDSVEAPTASSTPTY